MKLKNNEQEIGISINAADQEAYITITGYQAYLRKFENLSSLFPKEYKLVNEQYDNTTGEIYGRSYMVNKKRIRFSKPASEERKEQGRRAAEIMRARKGI